MLNIVNNKGIALLMVLWILMLLTVIVGEFCFTMRTQVNITRNFKETTEAYYIAVAGLNSAVEQMIQQMVVPSAMKKPDEDDALSDEKEEEEDQWRVNTRIPPMPYGNGEYTVWIDNEGGKVNINLADKEILRLSLDGFALDEAEKDTIVDSILDWRDEDDLHRTNGAEDDYYESLPDPYECKDGAFDSVEELVLVRGVTPEIFYGGLDQMVTVIPSVKAKAASPRKDAKTKKKKQFDYNKLNMNAIPPRLWASFPGMTQDALAGILEFRETRNFRSTHELMEIVGAEVYAAIAGFLTVNQTQYFTIRSVGKINDSRISEEVEAVVCLNSRVDKKYQIIQWKEGALPVKRNTAGNQPWNEPPDQKG